MQYEKALQRKIDRECKKQGITRDDLDILVEVAATEGLDGEVGELINLDSLSVQNIW